MAARKRKPSRKARVAPFVPSTIAVNPRDIVNQVLNDATWTVVTPDWAKWVQTKDDGSWVSNPAIVASPVRIEGAAMAAEGATKRAATKKRAGKK